MTSFKRIQKKKECLFEYCLVSYIMSSVNFKLILNKISLFSSVDVVCNIGWSGITAASLVFALCSSTIGLSNFEKSCLSCVSIFSLTLPSFQHWLLESTAVRESKSPGSCDVGDLVHGVQVQGSFFFGLTTRKESHTTHSWQDASGEGAHSVPSDLLRSFSVRALSTRSHHVWLQKSTFENKFVLNQSELNRGKNSLRNSSAHLNIMCAVLEDLRLNNRH